MKSFLFARLWAATRCTAVGRCARVRHPARIRCRENERASQRPFDQHPYTRLAEPNGLASVIWDIDVFVSRRDRLYGNGRLHSG